MGKTADVINNFYGIVFAENSIFGGANALPRKRRRRETGLLDQRDIDLAVRHYVQAPRHPEAAQTLGEDHLVIIEGKRGLGKRAAAIALLGERTAGPLIVLSPASTMRELARRKYEAGNGYLVVDQVDSKRRPNADFAWHTVRDAVREAGAFLVVTRREPVGTDVEIVKAFRWEQPPLADVVHAHLAGAEHDVDEHEVEAALPAGSSMTDIAKVTARVAAGDTMPDALRCLDNAAVDVVRAWFDADRSQQEILEVTALVFSTDVTREEFAARRAALGAHLSIDGRTQSPDSPNSLVVTGPSGTPAFAEARYRDQVLAELNTRQPRSFWDGVSAWLEEIVPKGADLSVAFGLSGLAKVDPSMTESSYLEPWSTGALGWNGQTTAAFVVWAMCLDELSVSTALRIVRDWVRGSAVQRQTAALALSGELGVRFPTEAMHELRRLLAQSPTAGDDTYPDAFGTLFGVLEAEGDDGAVVLELLARLVDDTAENRLPPHTKDLVSRSVLAALTAHNETDDEPALSSFLRDQPDRVDLISTLTAPLLVNPTFLNDALRSVLAGVADLKADEIRRVTQSLTEAVATVQATKPGAATVPEEPPALPAPTEDPDNNDSRYPIVVRRRIERHARVPMPQWARRRTDRLLVPDAHEALVFHVDGDCVKDPGRRRRSHMVARATHVSLVDMTTKRPVRLSIAIRSAADVPFIARIGFACTVVDPVRVAQEGTDDARQRLRDHLCSHHPLAELGREHHPDDVDHVRRDVQARVRAFLSVRPVSWPGLDVELTTVEVLAPPTTTNPTDPVEPKDAD